MTAVNNQRVYHRCSVRTFPFLFPHPQTADVIMFFQKVRYQHFPLLLLRLPLPYFFFPFL